MAISFDLLGTTTDRGISGGARPNAAARAEQQPEVPIITRDFPGLESHPPALRFSILGHLSAEANGRALPLGPLKRRLVLALLLCHPGAVVSVDLLTETLWMDDPPRTARKNLQLYLSALRKSLVEVGAGERLVHRSGGYLLRVAESELDALQFHAFARAGREAAADGDTERAAAQLGMARRLWNGPPLLELAGSEPLRAESARLAARHLAVCEEWVEAALESGRAHEVAETVGEIVEQHPLRERLRAAQMRALHRCGRRVEALAVYDELRQYLSREPGLSPSPALESVYRSLLSGEDGAPVRGRTAATSRSAPVELLPDMPDFTGRRDTMAEILAAVAGGGTVSVVVGPAGVGKTALAVRAAHRLADEFPGGRICLRLRDKDRSPRSFASVTDELLAVAGLAEPVPADPDRAAALWRAWLADRRVLLLLDDATDESRVRPLLPGPGPSAALVTARSPLAGLAAHHRFPLAPLTTAEALDMLVGYIGPGRVLGDRPAAMRILAACGTVPLAVRAAGLKLAVLRHLPLAEYAARLADPATVLDELAVGDLDVRAHAADDWRRLDARHREALTGLAGLPLSAAFTAAQAAAALGREPGRTRRDLELMIEAGAVVGPGSEVPAQAAAYSLPYLTHLYARLRAREA